MMLSARAMRACLSSAAALLSLSAPLGAAQAQTPAQPAVQAPAQAAAPATPPRLLVVISVDQFSADLFNVYRPSFTGGLARLSGGAVFSKGYQSHAATETCPGHSTILTGNRPGHTGIIANNWVDQSIARPEKIVYCSEDPAAPDSSAKDYVASPHYLRVPTLGGRMKAANPASRVISVAGKDRAAIMMGGPTLDQIWWWGGNSFTSYRGVPTTPLIDKVNAGIAATLAVDRPALEVPAQCAARDYATIVSNKTSVGNGHFARKAGDARAFRASPELDASILALASTLIADQKLGKGPAADIISIGLSATDYVGHTYGPGGAEMCIQLANLDQSLGSFFEELDAQGVDYLVTLTADHGGLDLPERSREIAATDAERVDPGLSPKQMSAILAAKTGLTGDDLLLADGPFGDIWVNKRLKPAEKTKLLAAAITTYKANRQVAAVFTHAELAAAPEPSGPPESWSLLQEAKASFDPQRSGDLVVLLQPRVTPIMNPDGGYVATHGSPWDYDRRVPILFWRRNMVPFDQPLGVETVDIMPTLAAQIGLTLPATGYDGKCLDLIVGPASSCPASSGK
jgi:predicted AlkP superfamily pyrophosphatase or phosphodiesterase